MAKNKNNSEVKETKIKKTPINEIKANKQESKEALTEQNEIKTEEVTPKDSLEEIKKVEAEKVEAEKVEVEKVEAEKVEVEKVEVEDDKETYYKVTKEYTFTTNSKNITLKKGKKYSKTFLVKLFPKEGTFNYKMKCTNMKHFLEEIKKGKKTKKEMMLLINDDLIVNENETLKKGEKISLANLAKKFTKTVLGKLFEDKKLMEIKVNNNVQI
ncbi:MAG: hypothetical protein ACJASR_001429 [Psychroserpens sp.]|jgi:hypothetical protein